MRILHSGLFFVQNMHILQGIRKNGFINGRN